MDRKLKFIFMLHKETENVTDYRKTYYIRRTLQSNKIVDHSDEVPALLQPHPHSRLSTWLQWIGQRQLQDDTRNI